MKKDYGPDQPLCKPQYKPSLPLFLTVAPGSSPECPPAWPLEDLATPEPVPASQHLTLPLSPRLHRILHRFPGRTRVFPVILRRVRPLQGALEKSP